MQPSRDPLITYMTVALRWSRQTNRDGSLIRLSPPENAGIRGARNVFFSMDATGEGADREVAVALDVIQDIYEKSRAEIERELAGMSHDLLLGTIPDHYLRSDTIEVRAVRSYMNGMRGTIAASAAAEMAGRRSVSPSKKAYEYADRCGFGHTFRGSFGLVIEAPLGGVEQETLDNSAPTLPLGRRIVQRLASGLASLKQATETDDPDLIVKNDAGLNAGMCKDLLGIIEQSAIPRIDLRFAWSPGLKEPPIQSSKFSLEVRQVRVLDEARKRLANLSDIVPAVVVGRVFLLQSVANPADVGDRPSSQSIKIKWESPEYGLRNVVVALDPSQYRAAYDAHGRGSLVLAEGTLSKKGWRLDDVTKFTVLEAN